MQCRIEKNIPPELKAAIASALELMDIESSENGIGITLQPWTDGLRVSSPAKGEILIQYSRPHQIFRGLAHIKRVARTGTAIEEKPKVNFLSYMVDVSRGAAIRPDTLKRLIQYLALLGYNDMMLYMEDMYELPAYPYFGYQRGRYTKAELKELVAFAESYGLTITPAIQTLGHLAGPLMWPEHAAITDAHACLYVGKDETCQFVDAMLSSVCEIFPTRRIHLGMDEAFQLGKGNRLEKEGFTPRSELMRLHLQRIAELCRKHGLSPMIYSDMFFRPHTADGGYYSRDVHIPDDVIEQIPPEFTLVYWDYNNCRRSAEAMETFEHMLAEHQRFHNPVAFAGGAWKWMGFAPNNTFSMLALADQLDCCIEQRIQEIYLTGWGDDGAEASVFANMPAVMFCAEKMYTSRGEAPEISQRFLDIFSVSLEQFLLLDIPNRVPDAPPVPDSWGCNPSKYLLYSDPLCGRADICIRLDYGAFYEQCERQLSAQCGNARFGYLFQTLAALCAVLQNKATLPIELRRAYLEQDAQKLRALADKIPQIVDDLDLFIDVYREQWIFENRLTGFESLEMRFGALRARLIGTEKILQLYLAGKIARIEPLEEAVLHPWGSMAAQERKCNDFYACSYREIEPVTCLLD